MIHYFTKKANIKEKSKMKIISFYSRTLFLLLSYPIKVLMIPTPTLDITGLNLISCTSKSYNNKILHTH